ncbi:MAG: hypothetical protein HYR77_07095 [Ignavibacteria bacterium]|nr:hypothetical protein [Ignavibacteria bacterium]
MRRGAILSTCWHIFLVVLALCTSAWAREFSRLSSGVQQQSAALDTTKITVAEGWNLISLPLVVEDARVSVLFPTAISPAFAYDGTYLAKDTMHSGVGYWLKFPTADTISILGQPLFNNVLKLSKGWNMIGTLEVPIAVSQITSMPTNIVVSQYFHYNPGIGYVSVDTLFPEEGYWVKIAQTGMLKEYLNDDASPALVSPPDSAGATIPSIFMWRRTALEDSTGYRLQVASDSLFAALVVDTVVTDTTATVTTLVAAQRYFWRVGHSAWRWFVTAWQDLGLGNEPVTSFAADWSNPNILYAGSFSDFSSGHVGGVFRSTNGGASWDTLLRGIAATDINIHPSNPNIVYVTAYGNGVTPATGILKSTDRGSTWAWVDSGLNLVPEEGTTKLSIDPLHPETLYVGTSAFRAGRLFESTNGGQNWFESARFGDVYSIAIDPRITNCVFLAVGSCALYETRDAGQVWHQIACIDTSLFSVAVDPIASESLYAGTSDGFFLSADSGVTWIKSDVGLTGDRAIHVSDIFTYPLRADHLYINISSNSTNLTSYIYRSQNRGSSWEPLPYSAHHPFQILRLSPDGKTTYVKTTKGLYKYLLDDL